MEPSLSDRDDLTRSLTRCELALEELRQLIRQTTAPPSVQPPLLIDQLPPEIWGEIFQHLSPRDLCNVRLSCRKWSAVVACSSRLMKSFPLRINSLTLAKNRDTINSLAGSSCRFSMAKLSHIELDNPGICYWFLSIWNNVAQSIQSLHIDDCNIPTSIILKIVAKTVNLQEFSFYLNEATSFDELEQSDFNFKLSNLLKLSASITNRHPVVPLLKWFRTICQPRIKVIKLNVYDERFHFAHGYEQAIVELIRMCCETLKEIEIALSDSILLEMAEMRGLDLQKLIIIADVLDSTVVNFTKNMRNIEHLSYVDIKDFETLVEISKYLPKLKWGWFVMSNYSPIHAHYDLLFLKNMPNLEHLAIILPSTNMLWLKTITYISPKLTDLTMKGVRFSRHVLLNNLRQAPNIRSIILINCRFDHQSDVVHLITQLKTLEHIELRKTTFENHDSPDLREIVGFSSIRKFGLSLDYDDDSQYLARMLINLCPLVEELEIDECADDDLIREICQCLEKLNALRLDRCHVTDNGVLQLVSYQERTSSLRRIAIWMREDNETVELRYTFRRILEDLKDVHVIVF